MIPNISHITVTQELLRMDKIKVSIDGVLGNETSAILSSIKDLNKFKRPERKLIAYLQIKAKEHGFNPGVIDGLYGQITDAAFEQLKEKLYEIPYRIVRPEDLPECKYPKQYTEEFYNYYGDIENIQTTKVKTPYPMRLSWDPQVKVHKIAIHVKLADSLSGILQRVTEEYNYREIEKYGLDIFGGSYNKRRIRGGKKWSTHAWAIAVDFYPEKNRLRWGADKAVFARPEYDRWWNIWEGAGWLSLGRKCNFDYMHIQAANI